MGKRAFKIEKLYRNVGCYYNKLYIIFINNSKILKLSKTFLYFSNLQFMGNFSRSIEISLLKKTVKMWHDYNKKQSRN